MTKLFDGSQVDDSVLTSFEPVPNGTYKANVTACEHRTSETTGSQYFSVEWTIADGAHAGRFIWDVFMMECQSQKAVNIGRAKMKRLVLAATGKVSLDTEAELLGRPVLITTKLEQDKRSGELKPRVVSVKPVDPSTVTVTAPTTTTTTNMENIPF